MLSRDADYAFYLYTCNRCRGCTTDGTEEMRPVCAPHAKYGYFSYSGGGKGYVAQGILEGKVKPEEAIEVAMKCLLCGACHHMCPPGFETISFIRDLRNHLVSKGHLFNKEHGVILENLKEHLNPWGIRQPVYNNHLNIPLVKKGMELAIYVGCRERSKGGSLHSALKILEKAGVSFGIIRDEKCCGAPMLELGDQKTYEKTAKTNIKHLNNLGVDRILTLCPHCATSLCIDYMDVGDLEIDVVTLPTLINELIEEGRLTVNGGDGEITITYHDPCHLGRFLDEYDPPREIFKKIPGLELVEMERSRETALCCGSGGLMNMIVPDLAEFAIRERIIDVKNTGADTAVTACDYCTRFFWKSIKKKDGIKVKHIADVVLEHIE